MLAWSPNPPAHEYHIVGQVMSGSRPKERPAVQHWLGGRIQTQQGGFQRLNGEGRDDGDGS